MNPEHEYREPVHLARLELLCRRNGWRWGITVCRGHRLEMRDCTVLDPLIIREPTGDAGNRTRIIEATIFNGDPMLLDATAEAMLELMQREGMLS